MATIKKYNGSTWENTIARKYETKSEIIVPPTTIYADGSNITTYTIKGNTVQNGTPAPTNPIAVNGVGELDSGQYKIPISSGSVTTNIYLGSTQTVRQVKKLVLTGGENWNYYGVGDDLVFFIDTVQDYAKINANICICSHYPTNENVNSAVLTQYGVSFYYGGAPYRLYIKDTSISDVSSLTQYLEAQYSAGTPVTVWYVLTTPETAAVNEPLMKIGNYADTLSNAASIPTTEGANSITVDTTVQPSEFTATWTGWHDSSVKEWDGSQWD